MWAGHPDWVPPGKQLYPGWAGHPDRVPPGTLASCGLEKPAHALRGLEEPFFPVVLLCQFLVLAGNRFWFYVHDDYYDRKKKVQSTVSCRDRYICISST